MTRNRVDALGITTSSPPLSTFPPTVAWQIPSLHMCAGPVPALFCTGQDTGIIVDVGSREAHVLAVYRGVLITSSYVGAREREIRDVLISMYYII